VTVALALVGDLPIGLLGPLQDFLAAGGDFLSWFYGALEDSVRHATGPLGLFIIGLYSFLIAFILPLPSEVVLAPASHMHIGLPYSLTLAVIVLVSGLGKAAGSVFAFHIGQEAKEYGPLVRRLKQSRFDIVEWSERKTVQIAKRFGYVGLAMALSVPGFPDTISIYAFTILEEDYFKFALATFAGSVGRLLVTIGLFGGAYVLL
jgi:membrane protein YqaA with SNARE-associated domain